jgi:serine/threonine protein phosphatase PrpC
LTPHDADETLAKGAMPLMQAIAAGLSDVGLQREHNEDSFLVLNEYDLYVVADGMGGHRAGDVASRIATETISEFFKSTANDDVTWPFHFDTNLSEEENRLLTGIRVANRQIFERSTRSREYQGMGTTVVGAMFSPKKQRMYIGHVGDSRCYRIRGGKIQQLTRDHSLINDYLVAMPDLTEEQRSELPKNVITRALGMQDQVVVDLQHDDPHAGDVYILCSDGLSGMMNDDEIQRIVTGSADIRLACKKLIERANEQGGEDNITAVVIKIESKDALETSDTERGNRPVSDLAKTTEGPLPEPPPAPQNPPKAAGSGPAPAPSKPGAELRSGPDAAQRIAAADKEFGDAETSPGFVAAIPPKKTPPSSGTP